MLFEIIGVQLDQAGDQVITMPVVRAGAMVAVRLQVHDQAVAYCHGSENDLVSRDDPGVGDDPICRHVAHDNVPGATL